MVFSLFQSTGTSLSLPGHSKINKGPCKGISQLPQHLRVRQSVRLTDCQVKCTLTQSSTKVLDFPSSLRGLEFLHAYFTGSDWCKGSRVPQPSPRHGSPAPLDSRLTLCCPCPWRISSCCSAWRLRNYPTANGYPQATCPLPHTQCSPETSRGNKEKAFIAQGGCSRVQADCSGLCFVQWKATYWNDLSHVLLFKVFIPLCVSTTISNFCINV